MRRLKSSLLAGATVACLAMAVPTGMAAESADEGPPVERELPKNLELEFEAYFGGLHVASARTVIQINEADYTVEGRVRARGLLDWFSSWKGYAVSEGVFDPISGVVPTVHRNEGYFQGDKRTLELTFNPDDTVTVVQTDTEEEDPDEDEKTPVPPDSLGGTVDPFSAIVSLAAMLNTGAKCEGSIPIYDGRRRYDLNLTAGETKEFEANRYSIFSGTAEACVVDIERIGGFRVQRSKYTETARDRFVWVAAPLEGIAPIPVRLDIETDYGNLLAHLTAARYGDQEIALSPGIDNLAD